jgi:transcriptional regulator with XRE-family HTH domain
MQRELAELRSRALEAADHIEPNGAALVRYAAHFLEMARRAQGGELVPLEEQLARLAPAELAHLVQRRREDAGMSLRLLARRARLALNTVRGVERGQQAPTPKTLARLLGVPELGLSSAVPGNDAAPRPNAWLLPQYNRRALLDEMREVLNAPGGRLEQTCLYLDDESAADWLALASAPSTLERFRALPFDALAQHMLEELADAPIEVVALGPGDGRSEIALCSALLRGRPALDLHVYLLDISHSLVTLAHERARCELPAAVRVEALHGDFRHMARYPVLRRQAASPRRRCYVLLGGTLANVENEIPFIRDGLSQAAPGDLAVVDFQTAWADARNPEQIRALDPSFRGAPSGLNARWVCGPLRRYSSGVTEIQPGVDLVIDCPIRGSYEVDVYADVTRSGETHRYHMVRVRRYEPEQLLETFARLGWHTVTWMRYGPDKHAAVALLRRGG